MRPDLAALSDEVLVTLANRGLLKRARKMLAKGRGPVVSVEGEVVVGVFDDGVKTRLEPGVPLAESDCSCGAPGVCRHRIAVVLACRDAAPPPPVEDWSPAEFDDAALIDGLGKRLFDRASRLARRGLVVEVLGDGSPTARLLTCTVRFLVPHDLGYARCDCKVPELCEHVALAVFAWRRAARVPSIVELGARADLDLSSLEELVDLSRGLIEEGVVNAPESLVQRFAVVRSRLAEHDMVWPLDLCEDIEDLLGAYRARSARYRSELAAELLVEPTARLRAVQARGRTPPGWVLGTAEARQTSLEKTTLVALGCRIEAFGRQRQAEVYLAEPGSGTVLVLRRTWNPRDDQEPPDAPALARRVVAGGVKLRALAAGQVITQVARRRANRLLVLGRGRTSATPQPGDWDKLPPPLRVSSLSELAHHRASRAPRMLRPRLLAEGVVVLPIQSVLGLRWAAGEQAAVGLIELPGGEVVEVVKRHRGVVPGACAAVIEALSSEPRFVAGELTRGPGGFELDPLSIVTSDGVVVVELAPARPVHGTSRGESAPIEPVGEALSAALALLAEGAHVGLSSATSSWVQRLGHGQQRLERVGLARCGWALATVGVAARAARSGGDSGALVDAWLDARIRLGVAAERL